MPRVWRTLNNLHLTFSKKVSILFVVLLIALSIVNSQLSIVSAQSALEKAQSDYTFQFTKYRDAQETYITARAGYLTYKTAVAKNDAYLKTRDYLAQIDKLYISFIYLVQEYGNQINWNTPNPQKENITKILADEARYFNDLATQLNQTKTLEDLPSQATKLKDHINGQFEPKLNKIIATYEVVEVDSNLGDFIKLTQTLDRIVIFKIRGQETRSILANWSTEIIDIREKTQNALDHAQEALGKLSPEAASLADATNISKLSNEAHRQLLRSKPLFEEVLRIL